MALFQANCHRRSTKHGLHVLLPVYPHPLRAATNTGGVERYSVFLSTCEPFNIEENESCAQGKGGAQVQKVVTIA